MGDNSAGIGQYDLEYSACPCFWGKNPAKYVKFFADEYSNHTKGRALDIGAGEGKNALFLRDQGFDVVAVEVSRFACRNFINRMIEEKIADGISLINSDATRINEYLQGDFDLVVSYGFLHCLAGEEEAQQSVECCQRFTKAGGINIVSAFTDKLPVPQVQDYLSPTLLDGELVLSWYSDWEIIKFEEDIIIESHPTSLEEHKHSLFRMIVRKPT